MRAVVGLVMCAAAGVLALAVLWSREPSQLPTVTSTPVRRSADDFAANESGALPATRTMAGDSSDETSAPAASVPDRCRALTDAETARIVRQLRAAIDRRRTALATPPPHGATEAQQYTRLASLRRSLALEEAALSVIEDGGAFLAPHLLRDLRNDSEWYHWNMRLRTEPDDDAIVYVPLRLSGLPEVASALADFESMRAFGRSEEARAWNALDRGERQQLVEAAKAAQRRFAEIEQELEALGSQSTAADAARAESLQNLRMEASELVRVISRVPRRVDPTSLEILPR